MPNQSAQLDANLVSNAEHTEIPQTMDAFLADIEKRAYRMVNFAVHGHADAVDLLQDSMIKLVTKYSDRKPEEWKPLLYKILQNRIRDWQRHQTVRNMVLFWKPNSAEDETQEEWAGIADDKAELPDIDIEKKQQQQEVVNIIKGLPTKQQQCFLLRSWEGLSVAKTAEIMECSEGSVKTHFFRATQKIKETLEANHDFSV